MSWIARFRIKNALIIANLISNAIGVTVVNLLAQTSNPAISERLSRALERTTLWFTPAAFLFPLALCLIYERTIRRHFEEIFDGKTSDPAAAMEARRGLVLQYIGDEIEAVFGAPVHLKDHAGMAVLAAREMATRLRVLNDTLAKQGYPALSHGIGIHTGEVVAANIGSPDRLSYTLVGDTVNLASRLQDLNKDLGTEVILSGSTRSRLEGGITVKKLPPQHVKGKSQQVEVYTLAL